MKALAALFLAVIAVAIVVAVYRADPDRTIEAHEAREAKKARESKFSSPSVVLSINAGKASPPIAAAADAVSPMAREFEKSRSLKPLYDRLSAPGGAATPEGKYFLYKILARCAYRSDAPAAGPRKTLADRRKEIEAQIPMTSQDREKRLAMFDQINSTERCAGFENIATTRAELDQMLKDAAAAGDPKARAAVAASQIMSSSPRSPAPGPPGPGSPAITDAQYQTLRDAVASRDPEAIIIAGAALSSTYRDAVIEVGPNHEELQGRASYEAWRLVACEFGAECGPGSQQLQFACAYSGQCAATTVPDYVYFYGVSPYEAQLIDQYRQAFHNAAANNDWSGLELSRRPNNPSSRFSFSSSPP